MNSQKLHPLNLLYFSILCTIILCSNNPTYGQHTDGEWQLEYQRAAIAPEGYIDTKTTFKGKATLALTGAGKDHAAGYWYKIVDVQPDVHYRFRTTFKSTSVDEPARSILARVIWQNEEKKVVGFREYPATLRDETADGWRIIEQTYKAPEAAKTAKLELHYRWDGDGIVNFGETTFKKVSTPEPRMVRLATIHHRPRNSKSIQENLTTFAKLIDKAGAQNADIVCLPEAATTAGTPHDYISGSEPVPGPSTEFLGQAARKNNMYIVAGLLERDGDVVYNTAVLIDRNGRLAGKYRKASLPREEIDGGITPGDEFPVFDTDFGRIGIMICWDVFFPEPARALAMQGAEVIFLPIWGGNFKLAQARAIENQVYLVSSTYDMVTAVFDLEGEMMKQGSDNDPVVVVDVDLNEQKLWPWLGDFKNRIPREMPSQKAMETSKDMAVFK